MAADHASDARYHAWKPGLSSTIPARLRPSITLYRPDNAELDYSAVNDAARVSGLPATSLVVLKIERLIVHELLVRVTADLSVPDGPNYADLGISLRAMVDAIYSKYMLPKMATFADEYNGLRNRIGDTIGGILTAGDGRKSRGWFGKKKLASPSRKLDDHDQIAHWQQAAAGNNDGLLSACYVALAEVGAAITAQHGRLIADHALLCDLASRLVVNGYGAGFVRRLIDADFVRGATNEGYQFLPAQAKPIVMNTKGASAAGKSTLRPKQRQLALRLGARWEDFALISPDYWRKYLLDYGSLGADYKYAAMLTGHELTLVDGKLDDYMAEKAAAGNMPHLLIDRFRFDSFNTDAEGAYQSNLLTRFGDNIFLFFVITSPAATVERAWQRGLETQRYKAVDDLLFHNIEAFTGIAELFFSWVQVTEKTIHFEFIDNDQPADQPPRTIAFGRNKNMVILDPVALANIDRFRAINVNATKPSEVLKPTKLAADNFISQCISSLDRVAFADFASSRIYGETNGGHWCYQARGDLPRLAGLMETLAAIGWDDAEASRNNSKPATADDDWERRCQVAHKLTLGRWGLDSAGG